MDRKRALSILDERIGDRRLIWLGYCGEDARPLLELKQFFGSYSLFGPLEVDGVDVLSIESETRTRYNDMDTDAFGTTGRWIVDRLFEVCRAPSVIVPFTRFPLLSTLMAGFQVDCFGPSRELGRFLNSKPLVESALSKRPDLQVVPWKPVPIGALRMDFLESELRNGPIVLRISPAASGRGHELIQERSQLEASDFVQIGSVKVAPYLGDHVSVNVGGCVFPDGGVTLHTPSVQLIGIPSCTRHDFGYCGNDFAAIRQLERAALDELETMILTIGSWLHSLGYIGAFGIDALIAGNEVVFSEINPRFQASSRISARLDAEVDLSDIMLDHLMAWSGVDSYQSPPLRETVEALPEQAHLICHNLTGKPARLADRDSLPSGAVRTTLVPGEGVVVRPDARLFSLEFDGRVTSDGKSLDAWAKDALDAAKTPWREA